MSIPTVQQLITEMERLAPPAYAEPRDPVGLQLGRWEQVVHKVMVTLDVRPEVVAEAVAAQVDLIIAHHPMMFHPAVNLDLADPQNAMYATLLRHDISVFAAHTNLDEVSGGMNTWLAEVLGLTELRAFNPRPKAEPQLAAYLGVVGRLPQAQTVREFAVTCKSKFQVAGLRLITHQPDQLVEQVAIIGGDGGKFYPAVAGTGAQVLITGDVYYHTAHDMLAHGLSVIDPGHHIEAVIKTKLPPLISQWAQANNWQLSVCSSQLSTDPFQFI